MTDRRISLPKDMAALDVVLNVPSHGEFRKGLASVAEGYGFHFSEAGCNLPRDIEEEDHVPWQDVDHAEFYFPGSETLHVPLSDFRRYLAMAVEAEVAARPEGAAELKALHAAADGWLAAHPLVMAGKA